MAKNNNLGDFLKDIASGIRNIKGTSGSINAQNFRSEIESIEVGGGEFTQEDLDNAYNQGYSVGHDDGYRVGESDGYTSGLQDGYSDGYNGGYSDGYDDGYNAGYSDCIFDAEITLSDFTTKNIKDITYDDELLVWDFDNGCLATAKPLWIRKEGKVCEYTELTFDNGTTLKLVGPVNRLVHRIFNYDTQCFEYGNFVPIGSRTFTDTGETPRLVSIRVIKDEVPYYNIITKYYVNLFANGILTSCRYSNTYDIKNMKYVKENRRTPIEDYGVNERWYDGLRLGEIDPQKISIQTTKEYIAKLEEREIQ